MFSQQTLHVIVRLFQRVPTGIPKLDVVMEGGLPKAGLFLAARTPEGLASVQIFDITGKGGPNTMDLGGATVLQPFDMFWKTPKRLRKPDNRLLSIIGFDALEARYAKDLPAMQGLIIETIAKVRNAGDIMISMARPFSNTLRALASASDVHLRLVQHDGVLCLLGVKPRTDYYDVSLPDLGSHAQIELVQVS
jgi:hypothetical protein